MSLAVLLKLCYEEGNEGHTNVCGGGLREQKFVQSDINFKIKLLIFFMESN